PVIQTYAYIFTYISLYDACYNIFLFAVEMIIDNTALFFFDLLYDNASCMHRRDSSEIFWCDLNAYLITQFIFLIDGFCFSKADFQSRIHDFFYNLFQRIYIDIACLAIHIYDDI